MKTFLIVAAAGGSIIASHGAAIVLGDFRELSASVAADTRKAEQWMARIDGPSGPLQNVDKAYDLYAEDHGGPSYALANAAASQNSVLSSALFAATLKTHVDVTTPDLNPNEPIGASGSARSIYGVRFELNETHNFQFDGNAAGENWLSLLPSAGRPIIAQKLTDLHLSGQLDPGIYDFVFRLDESASVLSGIGMAPTGFLSDTQTATGEFTFALSLAARPIPAPDAAPGAGLTVLTLSCLATLRRRFPANASTFQRS